MNEKYIVKRSNGTYRVKIYNARMRFSKTCDTLDEAIAIRDNLLEVTQVEPRILILDIETSPRLAWTFGLWNENIYQEKVEKDWKILCFGFKWLDKSPAHVVSLLDFHWVEEKLVLELYALLEEADIVVAHNAVRFDVARIRAKFLEYGLPRPAPFKTFDTLKTARKYFDMTYNKLDYIDKLIGFEGKLEHEGIQLWIDCMHGCPKAWGKMVKYNEQDILVLERVYKTLRGWDPSHPNLNHYYADGQVHCPNCGGLNLTPTNPVYTNVSQFAAYRCDDCGAYARVRFRDRANPVVTAR